MAAAARALRRTPDFDPASGTVPLQDGALPPVAERIAQREGVQVVAVALREDGRVPADRVRKALAAIRRTLGEVLLV
ncbi:MAG TPA: hypothetical protein VFL91_22805, partial [Thermomicrobiales bacterium]|nr:hypothetical protein [Thermomicrobiales bacterium]